ncbi:MAG: hypothetical protein JRI95_12530 [Deltaproteobacteria bacterium]|nr:hypothetical protein [Deltaproteobacteria bacterium]MBW2084891.1 hypothetical protein [Deltaproteobacteria bacterium]
MEVIYKTGSGNQYPVEVLFHVIQTSEIPYNRELTIAACRNGCRLYGRNGGCPPFAPDFRKISLKRHMALVILAKLRTEHYPIRVLQGPYYVRWVFIESTITRLLDKLGRETARTFSTIFLGSGHCLGCKNKKCTFKSGTQKCVNPTERIFSMEATGIIVTDLVEQLFGFPLHWWRPDEPSHVPPYMCKVVCLLSRDRNQVNEMRSAVEAYLTQL